MEKISWTNLLKNGEVLVFFKKHRTYHIPQNEVMLSGLVTSCVGTAVENMLLKEK
jgi:hypothetical protein